MPCALPIRSEEHTSELQSHDNLVCRLLLEKKKLDRKSTRLNSSHTIISYAVFCLQKKQTRCGRIARAVSRRVRPYSGAGGADRGGGDRGAVAPAFFLMIRRPPRPAHKPYAGLDES